MAYFVDYTVRAARELEKLDKPTSALIVGWIKKNLDGCENPRQHGKGLTANRGRQWRYRVGDYRLFAEIRDNELIIFLFEVAHRREIYK